MDGSRDDWAKVMALVACAVLEMLICLCEALDAGALVGMSPAIASTARDDKAVFITVPRQSVPGKRRLPSSRFAPSVRVVAPRPAAAHPEVTEIPAAGPWLAWSRDPGPLQSIPRSGNVIPSRKAAFLPRDTHAHFVALS